MKQKFFDPGQFNRQLTVENEVEVADGCGGFSTQHQSVGAVWASIQPLSSKSTNHADNEVSELTHLITVRFNAAISKATRFVTGTRRFQVIFVRNLDEAKRYLECECVERK